MFAFLFKLLEKNARVVIAIIVAITIVFAAISVTRSSIASRVEQFFDPAFKQPLNFLEQSYGIKPRLHLTIEKKGQGGVFSYEALASQSRLFGEMEKRWPIKVDSLATILNNFIAESNDGDPTARIENLKDHGVINGMIYRLWERDPYEFERIARKALSSQGIIDTIAETKLLQSILGPTLGQVKREVPIVEATRATITLNADVESLESRKIFSEIRDYTDSLGDYLKVRFYSSELVGVDIDNRIKINSPFVIFAMLLLLGAFLYRSFRSWFFTLVPLATLVGMLILSFGIGSLAGIKEWSFMTIVPIPLLLGQTIDNLVHFNERFRAEYKNTTRREALRVVFRTAGRAALLTTFINASAFLVDMYMTNLRPVKDYALIVVLGIVLAFFLTYLVGAAAIFLYRKDLATQVSYDIELKQYGWGLRMFAAMQANSKRIIVAFFVILIGMGFSVSRIDTNYRPTSFMAKSFPTREAYEYERNTFLLYDPHYVLVKGDPATQESTQLIQSIEKKLNDFDDIEHIQGKVNVESIDYLISRFVPETLPKDRGAAIEAIKNSDQIINPVRLLTSQEFFPQVVASRDSDNKSSLIKFWPALSDSGSIKAVALAVDEVSKQSPSNVDVETTGEFLVFSHTLDKVVTTALWSGLATAILILLILTIVYRNITASLISMVPVIVGTVTGLGMLPILHVELNALNGTIAVLAIGLGIDYSIQIIMRYREELQKKETPQLAMQETFGHMIIPLGKAALLTSVGLFALTGLLPITGKFGVAAGVALLSAYGASILILPILAMRWVKK